ncbi:Hypothetical protein GbCGDNIH6_0766 [Granulibacter bethesdensis]|uniref:DUF447 domain-containing protein n=1 Tax=Granulibacter bethesdensis TaxID=364410 RepID=UPI00090C1D95|nr:DUF447 domain-containing protein [Granulibacter bethesdensis]APH56579.1 Hypothetical protein GbCGDNIH6_0766 [Granulibacter bethesdensis]
MIRETIVTTLSADGVPHLAPLGLIRDGSDWIVAPFHPSTTLTNLRARGQATASHTDDVRVFAGCLTGRRDWPLAPSVSVAPPRLASALAHEELEVIGVEEDDLRSRFRCRVKTVQTHAPFPGFNRAQSAVIEAAILASRLHMLPADKVRAEVDYLTIAITKTAGPREQEAWEWLLEKIRAVHPEIGLSIPAVSLRDS